jgi:hypothetical protein
MRLAILRVGDKAQEQIFARSEVDVQKESKAKSTARTVTPRAGATNAAWCAGSVVATATVRTESSIAERSMRAWRGKSRKERVM